MGHPSGDRLFGFLGKKWLVLGMDVGLIGVDLGLLKREEVR